MIAALIVLLLFPVGYFVMKKLFFGAGRGLAFGGKIRKTMGSVEGQRVRGAKAHLTIHALDRLDPEGAVGLELAISTLDGDEMHACRLSAEEARELASLLEAAAGPGSDTGWIKPPGAQEEG